MPAQKAKITCVILKTTRKIPDILKLCTDTLKMTSGRQEWREQQLPSDPIPLISWSHNMDFMQVKTGGRCTHRGHNLSLPAHSWSHSKQGWAGPENLPLPSLADSWIRATVHINRISLQFTVYRIRNSWTKQHFRCWEANTSQVSRGAFYSWKHD